MKTKIIFAALLLIASNAAAQEYNVTIKRHTYDPVSGERIFAPSALRATVQIAADDTVTWDNVGWGRFEDIRQEPEKWTEWPELSGFRYLSKNADMMSEEFYAGIPEDKREWAMYLATDLPWINEMAAQIIDSLEYKKPFYPRLMDNLDIQMENSYTFSSTYLKFEWIAVTEHNGTRCAVVAFESPFNPMSNGPVKGRSMYGGEMRVSLDSKQIEYFRMIEDVIFSTPPPDGKVFDLQRIVVFDKVAE